MEDNERISLEQFIRDNKITADVVSSYAEPPEDFRDCFAYSITLKSKGRRMTAPFYAGRGWTKEPAIPDVLDSLGSDAAGYENSPDFGDWASEYGYDTDSRKAERIFKAVEKQSTRLRKFLGEEAYDILLWHTERL